jgi:hypothetical protein
MVGKISIKNLNSVIDKGSDIAPITALFAHSKIQCSLFLAEYKTMIRITEYQIARVLVFLLSIQNTCNPATNLNDRKPIPSLNIYPKACLQKRLRANGVTPTAGAAPPPPPTTILFPS